MSTSNLKTNIYTNPAGLNHDTGPGHPEQVARLETILALLNEPPLNTLPVIECREMDTDCLLYGHEDWYIDKILEIMPDHGDVDLLGEVILSPGSWDAAVSAANTLCRAVDDVIAGDCARAFCAVRPPGHHALPERPMGFCVFNNIFIGARHAQEKHGIKRIAIVDFDVHHGNGTDHMARKAEDILLISSHQLPLWPNTGEPQYDDEGKTLNVPLAPDSDGTAMKAAYEEKIFPALDAFKPELLMISAGFDAHKNDPLAQLNWEAEDYAWLTEKLCAIADKHCGGKTIAALEGGYDLEALKSSVTAHLKSLAQL